MARDGGAAVERREGLEVAIAPALSMLDVGRPVAWLCPRPSDFSILVVQRLHFIEVRPCGDLNVASGGILRACVRDAGSKRPGTVVVDGSGIESVDSSGVISLLGARRDVEALGVKFTIVGPGDELRRFLERAGLATASRSEP